MESAQFKGSMMRATELAVVLESVEKVAARWPEGVFVEFGTKWAGTSWEIANKLESLCSKASFYGIDNTSEAEDCFLKRFSNEWWQPKHTSVDFIRGCSWEVGARWGMPLHWVLIDGCHCWYCLGKDMNAWLPQVPPGGSVLFHDSSMRFVQRTIKHPDKHVLEGLNVRQAMMRSKVLSREFTLVKDLDIPGRSPEGAKNMGITWYERKETV